MLWFVEWIQFKCGEGKRKEELGHCQGLTFKPLLIKSSKSLLFFSFSPHKFFFFSFLPLEGSLLLWFLQVPTIMICRYRGSLYNKAWHLPPAKNTGQCKVVVLCTKQMQNKDPLTDWHIYSISAFTRNIKECVFLYIFVCLWVCRSGQKGSGVHRWTDEWCRRAADAWSDPYCRLSLNHWLQHKGRGGPKH